MCEYGPLRRSGEIGRHARFRGVWRKLCGFESRLRHDNVWDVWSCEGRSIISPYVILLWRDALLLTSGANERLYIAC